MLMEDISLKPFHTFGFDVRTKWFFTVRTPDDWRWIASQPQYQKGKKIILGEGSNVLFRDHYNGLVIRNELKGIQTQDEDDEQITLQIQSGENWNDVVQQCVQLGYGGIENLALIPGTCGAAPIQNIGAYGVEIKEVIKEVRGMAVESGREICFTNEQCRFGYRDSIFKNEWKEKIFISSITLTLSKKNHRLHTAYGAIQDTLKQHQVTHPSIADVRDAVVAIRSQKLPDPRTLGNAGSFFKNPTVATAHYLSLQKNYRSIPGYTSVNQNVKIPAAWLIEQCGWKGKRVGQVGVHTQQALVLVHYGDAQGEEIFSLANTIAASVKEKFEIELSFEVNII